MDAKKLIELKQNRANLTNSIRTLMNEFENKEMPAEKKGELEKMEASFDSLNASIMAEEKQLDRERAAGEVVDATATKKTETRELFAKALSGQGKAIEEYRNALSLGVDATAGNLTAPMEFVQSLIKGLDNIMFMRQISNVVGPIGAAQSLGFPYRATEAADATWTPEVTAAGEEATVTYGRREFKPNKLARLIKLSNTLVQHAPIAESVVGAEITYRMNIATENAYMNGNGTNQPLGVFVANASGIDTDRDVATGNTATAVTFDGLQEAKYSLKQQYLSGASWVLHRDLAKMLAKIKDGEGQYVWQGSVQNGQPDRLLGAPVNMSEYAPNTYTAGLYAAVFGNFKQGYWICDADSMSIKVLNELYAVTNQIGYLFHYFGDGAPVLPEAFARVKMG